MSLLAHVLGPCDDPDCEIHRIEVGLQEETVTDVQLAFFIAGVQAMQEEGYDPEVIESIARERLPDDDELTIEVVPPTVPTTASAYHASATHVDALGMPVVFSERDNFPFHPTPCCGAAASINDGPMYCKACYAEVDNAFGNVPVEPLRPIEEVS